jgi:hypothetical protein
VDEEVLHIIGKNSSVVAGLPVPEYLEEDDIYETEPDAKGILLIIVILQIICAKKSIFFSGRTRTRTTNYYNKLSTNTRELKLQNRHLKVYLTNKYFNFKGKKRKRDIEENSKEKGNKKQELQIELLKLQIYKTKLETRKIEISMELSPSAYTVDIELNEYN